MKLQMSKGFNELDNCELQEIDGDLVIFGVTISGLTLLKIAGVCVGAGITGGITVGLNNKNRQ